MNIFKASTTNRVELPVFVEETNVHSKTRDNTLQVSRRA